MNAVVVSKTGGPEALEIREVATPEPRADQVRVRVRACGINRADLMQSRGQYPAPPGVPADRLGLEFAGEVESLGPGCTEPFQIGDRVFGIVGGGGMAEFVVTHERMLARIPENLDWIEAAAVPEVFLTAHDALETQAKVEPGECVLIQAVSGGVGSAALQLARAMGCTVFGTSRTSWKLHRCIEEFGLDVGIDASVDDFAEVVLRETGGEGVQAIIDHIGAAALSSNIAALATTGRLVLVGLLSGAKAEINLGVLLRKRITVVGTTLRARPLEEKIAVTQRFAKRVVPWLARGVVRPVVDQVFPFEQVREAQERLESNAGLGKIILRL